MRVGNNSLLASISMDLKIFKLHTGYSWILEQIKLYNIRGKFEPKPLQVFWQSLPKAIPKDNQRF